MLGADIWLQLQRGRSNVSEVTRPFVAIFVVNILLWIDFNITILRRNNHNEPRTSRQYKVYKLCDLFRQLETSLEATVELLGEDVVTFAFITPILWAFQWIRCSETFFLKLIC